MAFIPRVTNYSRQSTVSEVTRFTLRRKHRQSSGGVGLTLDLIIRYSTGPGSVVNCHSGKLRCTKMLALVHVHSGSRASRCFIFSGEEPAFIPMQNIPEIRDTWVVSTTWDPSDCSTDSKTSELFIFGIYTFPFCWLLAS